MKRAIGSTIVRMGPCFWMSSQAASFRAFGGPGSPTVPGTLGSARYTVSSIPVITTSSKISGPYRCSIKCKSLLSTLPSKPLLTAEPYFWGPMPISEVPRAATISIRGHCCCSSALTGGAAYAHPRTVVLIIMSVAAIFFIVFWHTSNWLLYQPPITCLLFFFNTATVTLATHHQLVVPTAVRDSSLPIEHHNLVGPHHGR